MRMLAGAGGTGETAPVEALPTAVPDEQVVATDATAVDDDGPGRGPRSDRGLRLLCHLAAELPLVVFGAVESARGWRPLYDNADLAYRSFQVFSSHSPLVGHQMAVSAGSHAVFGPGPLQSWILAVPVRVDPAQGALWGGVVAAVVAVALAVEATWSVGGWRGGVATAGGVLVFALVRPEVALDVVWNVWFALLFLVTTFCTALAVVTGRLRWWPVTVVAASVVVQCQAAFAPPAVLLCLLAPLPAVVAGRRRLARDGFGWLIAGFGAGVVVWAVPVLQEVTTRPGNLTLLVRAAQSGPTIGTPAALRALGGATRMLPAWVRPLPTGGGLAQFFGVVAMTSGPEWWGLAVLSILVAVTAVSWRTGRRTLAALSFLTLVAAIGGVVTVASIPRAQYLVLGYLGAVLALIGIAVWVTFAWAAAEVVVAGLSRLRGDGVVEAASSWFDRARWPAAAMLVGLSAWLMATGMAQMDGTAPTLSGWAAVRATDAASAAAVRVAPTGVFGLQVEGAPATDPLAVETGVAYQLATRGYDPRPTTAIGYPTFGRPPVGGPTVVVVLSGPGRAVHAHIRSGS